MTVYKLLRIGKDNRLYPLFINRQSPTPFGEWLSAECFPTKGFAVRKGWHCTLRPKAPHLKMNLANGACGSDAKRRTAPNTSAPSLRAEHGFSLRKSNL